MTLLTLFLLQDYFLELFYCKRYLNGLLFFVYFAKIYQFLISENFPSKTQCEINKFLTSLQNFKKKLTNENFIVDTVEIDKSGYHNGLMFKFYSDKLTELFSGGSYEVNKENCIGFSALVENLINN